MAGAGAEEHVVSGRGFEIAAAAVPGYGGRLPRPVGIGRPFSARRPMKPDIHPEYHEINVVMTDGTQFNRLLSTALGIEGGYAYHEKSAHCVARLKHVLDRTETKGMAS